MLNLAKPRQRLKKNISTAKFLQKMRLAMDVGSFYTRIMIDGRLVFNQPTCLLIDQKKEAVLAIGDRAWSVFGQEPTQTQVVFPIKQGVVYDQAQFVLFLQALVTELKQTQRWPMLSRIKSRYVVPAAATELDQKIIRRSLAEVGLSSVILIPKAEALLARLSQATQDGGVGNVSTTSNVQSARSANTLNSSQIVILDIGDQITELIIGSQGFVSFARTLSIGSHKISQAIMNSLRLKHDLLVSYQQASKIKHNLQYDFAGTLTTNDHKAYQVATNEGVGSKINIRGIDTQDHLVVTKTIKAEDLIVTIEQELSAMAHKIKRALSLVKSQQLVAGLNNGVILTGGGSQLYGLDDYLAQELQANVMLSPDPYLDVVKGLRE